METASVSTNAVDDVRQPTGQTVLVTGGGGFIGSHLVSALVGDNDVRVLDDFSTGRRSVLPDGVDVIEGDVRDSTTVERAVDGVDTVFHQAANASVTDSVDCPTETTQSTSTGR